MDRRLLREGLTPGDVVWVDFGSGVGREQQGRRPAVVVASRGYLGAVEALAIVVPVTTRDRGLPEHVELTGPTGLTRTSWAMSEQVLRISRERVVGDSGLVAPACLDAIRARIVHFVVD